MNVRRLKELMLIPAVLFPKGDGTFKIKCDHCWSTNWAFHLVECNALSMSTLCLFIYVSRFLPVLLTYAHSQSLHYTSYATTLRLPLGAVSLDLRRTSPIVWRGLKTMRIYKLERVLQSWSHRPLTEQRQTSVPFRLASV